MLPEVCEISRSDYNGDIKQTGRVIVIGNKGFIGKSIYEHLSKIQVPVVGVSRKECDLLGEESVHFLSHMYRPLDRVIFVSAITPSRKVEDVIKTSIMAENFCRSLHQKSVAKVTLVSSDSVYGDLDGIIDETTPCNPNSFHGLAQLSRELIFKEHKIANYSILRLCAVYGHGDTHNSYGPNRFMRQIQESIPLEIFGEGKNSRDHIYIGDVVKIVHRITESELTGTFNIATGTSHKFSLVAELFKTISGSTVAIRNSGDEGRITNKQFNVSKIKSHFPDLAFTSLPDGLRIWKDSLTYT